MKKFTTTVTVGPFSVNKDINENYDLKKDLGVDNLPKKCSYSCEQLGENRFIVHLYNTTNNEDEAIAPVDFIEFCDNLSTLVASTYATINTIVTEEHDHDIDVTYVTKDYRAIAIISDGTAHLVSMDDHLSDLIGAIDKTTAEEQLLYERACHDDFDDDDEDDGDLHGFGVNCMRNPNNNETCNDCRECCCCPDTDECDCYQRVYIAGICGSLNENGTCDLNSEPCKYVTMEMSDNFKEEHPCSCGCDCEEDEEDLTGITNAALLTTAIKYIATVVARSAFNEAERKALIKTMVNDIID